MTDCLRLVVKVIDAPAVHGGKAMALCTEDGEIVGQQVSCHVSCDTGDVSRVTASFHIDGEIIRFAD